MKKALPNDETFPRWKTAHRRLVAAAGTTTQHAVLAAVLQQTAARQRLTDRTSLGQIARNAGLWTGDGPASRNAARRAGQTLADLHDAGVITYRPIPGHGIDIALPEADWDLLSEKEARAFQSARATRLAKQEHARPGAREQTGTARASRRTRSRENETPDPAARAKSDAETSSHARSRARDSEDLSEDVVRGKRSEGDDAGPTGTASGGPSTDDAQEWDEEHEPDPDRLTKTLEALIPDGTPTGVDDDLDAYLIDRHLAQHLPDLRELIAIEIDTDELTPGQIRLTLRSARTTADRYSRPLPQLTLPRRSTR